MADTSLVHPRTIVSAWVERLAKERLLLGKSDAVASMLESWLVNFLPAVEGDAASAHELYKQLAFHARELGLEGKPASAAVLQVALLEDALASLGALTPAARTVVVEMVRVAADAHSLGDTERIRDRHQRDIRDFSPVIRLGGGSAGSPVVIAFLLGPMTPELIDSLAGRLLRECTMAEAKTAVIDLLGADADDDRFHRTIEAMMKNKPGSEMTLVLTGLHDPDATRARLTDLGIDMSRIVLQPTVNDFLAAR